MAKVAFSKLQAGVDNSVISNYYQNKAGESICYEVRHYLPFSEKLNLVENVINYSVDDNGFYNPMRVKLFLALEMMYAYTNLSFTDKMKEDPFKLYDTLISTGIFGDVIQAINPGEWEEIQESVWSTIQNIYDYKNSILGVLDVLSKDYSNLSLDAADIQSKIGDPENLELLKNILGKLG